MTVVGDGSPDISAVLQQLEQLPPLKTVGIAVSVLAEGPLELGSYALNLTSDGAEGIAEMAESTLVKLQKATPIAYAPAVLLPPQHVMHVPTFDGAVLGQVQALLGAGQADTFNPKATYARSVKLLGARFTTPSGLQVTFYRVADTLLRFAKKNFVGLVLRGGQYDRLEPADVLLLRPQFDVVVINNVAFFFAKQKFEQAFGFLAQLQAESGRTFDAVTTNVNIDGSDAFRAACTSQPQMMAKMASIKRSMDDDPAYAAAMTMPKLLAYVARHPEVKIEISGRGTDRAFVFDPTPARRFQILKLLDDDYLNSQLTARFYEAGSKTPTE